MCPARAPEDGLLRGSRHRIAPCRPGLRTGEVAAVLEAFAAAGAARPAAVRGGFDGVRVDASGGLGAELASLLGLVAGVGLEPLVAFPVAGAGDVGYSREGELVLDGRVGELLAAMSDERDARFAFLADPAAVISRCQRAPSHVWERTWRQLDGMGVVIEGLATSFHGDPASAYERLWVYMLRQGTPQRFDTDFAPAFRCREWNSPVTPGAPPLPDFCRPSLDQIDRVLYRGDQQLAEPIYARSFQAEVATAPKTRIEISVAAIVYSDGGGWRVLEQDGEGEPRPLETPEVLELVESSAARGAPVNLVIDPLDLETPAAVRPDAGAGRVRQLPYPHHYFIGLSSDVDWSTEAQFELQAAELCDRLGLEMAGSAYPFSPTPSWVAWAGSGELPDRPSDAAAARLLRWASEGLIDTCHGLASTFNMVLFRPAGSPGAAGGEGSADGERTIRFEPERPIRVADYDGILVTVRRALAGLDPPPELVTRTAAGALLPLGAPETGRGGELMFFHYDLQPAAGEVVEGLELRAAAALAAALGDVFTTFASRRSVERLLRYLRAGNVRLPVFTSHGGGTGSRRLGACVTEAHRKRQGEAGAMFLDSPGSPYHLLPALARFGVLFFNPIGRFGTKQPSSIGDVLRPDANRDGSSSYIFRRFCSRRYEEDGGSPTWSHGKLSSSAQGLAANLEDLLQRFHWLEPGHGAILYTHLGHGVGNRINDRLGWTEELHAAWERVAEFVHGRDRHRPVPFRLWHAPTSRVLAYSLVARELEEHLRVEGDEIHLGTWRDEVLDLDLPSPAGFGDAWLHGVTLYADDPAAAAVFVDGRRLEHLTINPADETGRTSVSLVDAGNLVPLLHGPGSLESLPPEGARVTAPADSPPRLEVAGGAELELPIRPVSVRNVSHWTFRLGWGEEGAAWTPDASLAIGLRLDDGSLFTAGTRRTDDWPLVPGAGGAPRTYTFALRDPQSERPERPTGRVVALAISQRGLARTTIAEIGLVRPLPVGRRTADGRIVAGLVRDPAGRAARRRIRLECGELELETESDADGFYSFYNLPDRRACELAAEGAIRWLRGRSVYTSSDFWDWDLVVGGAEDSTG